MRRLRESAEVGASWQSGGGRSSYTCLMITEDGGMAMKLSEGPP